MGNTIYYWKFPREPGLDTLVAARVQRTPVFKVLSRKAIPSSPDWVSALSSLHPSGDRIIVPLRMSAQPNDTTKSKPERFFVVVNWFEELKARLGK